MRLWSNSGEYIGTLGQPEPWSVYESDTWQHPMVPYDVLVDPENLPKYSCQNKSEEAKSLENDESQETLDKDAVSNLCLHTYMLPKDTLSSAIKPSCCVLSYIEISHWGNGELLWSERQPLRQARTVVQRCASVIPMKNIVPTSLLRMKYFQQL